MRKITVILILQPIFLGCLFSFPIVYGRECHSFILNGEGTLPLLYVPGEVLVKWKGNASNDSVRSLKYSMGLRVKKGLHTIGVQHLRIPSSTLIEEVLAKLRENPLVEYAEPNYIIRTLITPNDPQFDQLWGLDNISDTDIDAPEAWDITTGDNGVVIAVIDTGVAWSHPDLAGNLWTNPREDPWSDPNDPTTGNGIDEDCNGKIDDWRGWDFVGKDNDPTDFFYYGQGPGGHGTHVAGTIAAIGNNAIGITGVNWYASIMPLRIFGTSGYGDIAKAIEAITYAADNGAKVINASWGGEDFSQALYDAISYANAKRCLIVAAAGNGGEDLIGDDNDQIPFYPASYDLPNIISVAASDHNDNLTWFSNFGATSVDVMGPGVNVLSSVPWLGLGPENQVLNENFESGLGNWTHWGTNDFWDLTEQISVSPTHSLTDNPSGDYLNGTDSYIAHNTSLNLVDKYSVLEYQIRYALASGDYLYVGATLNGGGFFTLYALNLDGRFSGNSEELFEFNITNVSPFGGLSNNINLGFQLSSDDSDEDDGVYIDDVILKTRDIMITGDGYAPFSGTSMAAPHVSGLAGLILARYPGITLDELKDRILNGVDIITSLNGKILTNGRINAYKSLALPVGPTNLRAAILSLTQINLNWSDNSDPGFNEDGFRIERRKGTSGNYAEIATLGQNVTSYSDILSEWGTYSYRVRAYNSQGNSSYSNEATPRWFVEGDDGKCFIATAAFGSPLERHVQVLRDFRDRYLLGNSIGKTLVSLYYRFGPFMADFIVKNGVLRAAARVCLYPAVGLRYIAPQSSRAGNIMSILGVVSIVAGMIYVVTKRK
jgi:subtilisin family serine protease